MPAIQIGERILWKAELDLGSKSRTGALVVRQTLEIERLAAFHFGAAAQRGAWCSHSSNSRFAASKSALPNPSVNRS